MRKRMKLIFKLGLTVVILFSVGMYYVMNRLDNAKHLQQRDNVAKNEETGKDAIDDTNNGNHNHLDLKNKDDKELTQTSRSEHEQKGNEVSGQSSRVGSNPARPVSPHNPQGFAKAAGTRDGKHHQENRANDKPDTISAKEKQAAVISLSVVVCGAQRVEETITMLKSARILSKSTLHFYIFTEDELFSIFNAKLKMWPPKIKEITTYSLHRIEFPQMKNSMEWKKLFKPCAAQRLFIPKLLENVDSVLYVDTDILFLDSIDHVWNHFHRFNSSQIAGVSPEHEDAHAGWYNRFARHPYYGKLGINSGVMLMNLTRIRSEQWLEKIVEYYKEYRLKITWGDQDLINIYFHYHPDQLYVYPCEFNYRPDHCMYMSVCKTAELNGIYVLHGNRASFHNDKQPTFKAVYKAFHEFQFGNNMDVYLVKQIEDNVKATQKTNCGQVGTIFGKRTKEYVRNL